MCQATGPSNPLLKIYDMKKSLNQMLQLPGYIYRLLSSYSSWYKVGLLRIPERKYFRMLINLSLKYIDNPYLTR